MAPLRGALCLCCQRVRRKQLTAKLLKSWLKMYIHTHHMVGPRLKSQHGEKEKVCVHLCAHEYMCTFAWAPHNSPTKVTKIKSAGCGHSSAGKGTSCTSPKLESPILLTVSKKSAVHIPNYHMVFPLSHRNPQRTWPSALCISGLHAL